MRIYLNGKYLEVPEPRSDQLVRTMLQAEYDRLTEEEKEGLIVISDADTSKQILYSVSRSDIYSEEEKIVGRWVDGKPIYRKIVLSAADNVPIVNDVDAVVKATGYVHRLSDGDLYEIPDYSGSTSTIFVFKNNSLSLLKTGTGYQSFNIVYVLVEYTKLTDTPQTAKVAMNLTKYSTEEQIVGVWIDGRPVYRVTYYGLYVDANNLGEDVDTIIKAEGVFTFTKNDLQTWNFPFYDNMNNYAQLTIDDNGACYVRGAGNAMVGIGSITFEYVKTTDQGGTL